MAPNPHNRVDSQGRPVRRGTYNPVNRHGELQDVNQDSQVSFADTFIGDLLGFDGRMGLHGNPGMSASIGGARRQQPMQAVSGAPQENVDTDPATAPIDDPMSYPDYPPPGTGTTPAVDPNDPNAPAVDPVDDDGSLLPTVLTIGGATLGALGLRALKKGETPKFRDKGAVALLPAPNGMVTIESSPNGTLQEVTPQQAKDAGWQVVDLNYEDGSRALPAPDTKQVEGPRFEMDDDATRAIDSDEVMADKQVPNRVVQHEGSSITKIMDSPVRETDTIVTIDGRPAIMHRNGSVSPMTDAEFQKMTGQRTNAVNPSGGGLTGGSITELPPNVVRSIRSIGRVF